MVRYSTRGINQADGEIIQKIELLAEPLNCEITAVVQLLDAVNELIAKNSRFLTALYHKAVLVYDAGNKDMIVPPATLSYEEAKCRIKRPGTNVSARGSDFINPSFCLDNGWSEKALFDLHQATQHICVALLRLLTGYWSTLLNTNFNLPW